MHAHTHTHTPHTHTHTNKHTHTHTHGPQAPSIPKPFLRQTVFRGQPNTKSSTSSLAQCKLQTEPNANCTVKTITNSHNQCPASILPFPLLLPINCDVNFLSDILTAAKSQQPCSGSNFCRSYSQPRTETVTSKW